RKDERLDHAVQAALKDTDESVRLEAIALQAKLNEGAARLKPLLDNGSRAEQQAVLAALATSPGPEIDALVSESLDRLLSGKVAHEVQLDVLDAAAKRDSSE